MKPASLADVKAWDAMVTEEGPAIVFGSGQGDGGNIMLVVETEQGNVLLVIPHPPEWASDRLLAAFSARATASTTGSCPLCSATGSVGRGFSPDDTDPSQAHLFHTMYAHAEWCAAGNDQIIALYQAERPQPVKAGRNDPCPCGSGQKYKFCCGK